MSMDARHREVLIAIIREYIDSAEPVGSRALSKRQIRDLSPATLRNVMADLEEMGYLTQPHTSAGRVPTDKAYRFYVDSFPPPLPPREPVRSADPEPVETLDRVLQAAAADLSRSTKVAGLLLAPPLQHTALARIELIPLEKARVLAVIVTDTGWVTVRALSPDRPVSAEEAREIGRELTRRVRGRTVQEVLQDAAAPTDPLDPLRMRTRSLLDQILAVLRDRTLYVAGATNILDHPEFWDISTMRQVLQLFEQKERLVELLSGLSKDGGVQVIIGGENPVEEMQECTLVTSAYTYRDQVVGILGVIGPRRIRYPHIITAVEESARRVSESLWRIRRDLYLP
jgi:heat-inducible transcriptional repressor